MKKILLTTFVFSYLLIIFQTSNAQWAPTSGPKGINVNVFYQKGKALFAGTASKGVFKSTNHGVTWTPANSTINNLTVFSLTSDSLYLYAGTDNGTYRSSNNGATWTPANAGMTGQFVVSFLSANGYLFAGTVAFGLFKSNDHGNTWTDANGGALVSSSIYSIAYSSPNIVAVADNLVFYSNDNGSSWFYPVTSPFIFTTHPSMIVNGDSILLSSGWSVWRSFNSGTSWGSQIIIDESLSLCGLVASGNKIFVGSNKGIFSTKNFGATWQTIPPTGLRFGNRFNNAFYKSGKNFLLGMDELGVAYSTDKGLNWQYTTSGFPPASNIDNALMITGDTILCGTHSDGLYRSTNDGTTWTKIGTTDDDDTLSNAIIFSVLKKGNIILAGACGYGLYRSADNGATWTHITAGLPVGDFDNFLCVNSLAKAGTKMIIATDLGVYYSSNDGLTWNSTSISGTGYVAMGLASNGTTVCAAVNRFTGSNTIYRSTNSGVSWAAAFSTGFDDFVCMASDGVDHFYAGTFSNNYLSSTNGTSWGSFGPGMPAGSGAFTIAVQDNNVFTGNAQGLYFSNNNGASFTEENDGFDPTPNRAVQGLAISDNYVFAGLFQNAVWKRPLSDFGIVLKETEPEAASIHDHLPMEPGIFPNPIAEEGNLVYELIERSQVTILIFDETGKIAGNVWSAEQDDGIYNWKINGNEFAGGNYIASISIDGSTKYLKFIVIK
ncbi:MAG: T9SS type A sorting domain-containing protein [Chitinophagales bacterium]